MGEIDNNSKCRQLLVKTALRMRINSFIRQTYLYISIFLMIYMGLLLSCRLLALIPDYFNLISLVIPISLGILTGLFVHSRPTIRESAKLADAHNGSKDLFLTATLIDDSYGEYKPLVVKNAENQAEKVIPARVVKLEWQNGLRSMLLAFLVVALCSAFLPQLDPFGKHLARERKKQQQEKLTAMDKAVKKRLKRLKKRKVSKNSPEVSKLLAKTKSEFNSMKKSEVNANRDKLRELQRRLSEAWRKKNENKMRDQLERNMSKQSFGFSDKKQNEWRKQLAKNDFSGVKKEAGKLQQMAKQLSEMKDSKEKQQIKKELKKRMKELSDFMNANMGSQAAQGAIKQAMEQMDMAGLKDLNKEAMQALQNSTELLNRELERLGEMNRDIQDLEMAMEASQLAKQLNQMKELQGAGKQGLEEISDYNDFYQQMLQACSGGQGKEGNGQGNPGGGGGKVDENPDAETSNKKEISQSKLQAGKILMRWKTKGMGKSGKAKEEYLNSVKEVKQGVSEAILKEQVPPGYHESIKKYFDNMKEK